MLCCCDHPHYFSITWNNFYMSAISAHKHIVQRRRLGGCSWMAWYLLLLVSRCCFPSCSRNNNLNLNPLWNIKCLKSKYITTELVLHTTFHNSWLPPLYFLNGPNQSDNDAVCFYDISHTFCKIGFWWEWHHKFYFQPSTSRGSSGGKNDSRN